MPLIDLTDDELADAEAVLHSSDDDYPTDADQICTLIDTLDMVLRRKVSAEEVPS